MSKSSSTSSLKSLGAKIGDIKWFSGRRRKGSVEPKGKEVDKSGREEEEDVGSSGGEREDSRERHSEDEV